MTELAPEWALISSFDGGFRLRAAYSLSEVIGKTLAANGHIEECLRLINA